MKEPGSQNKKAGVLRSKVGRRIFLLFIFCALLPLGLMAYFSLGQVTTNLHHQAEQLLHQESKAVGMATIERLYFLETDLKMVISEIGADPVNLSNAVSPGLRERLMSHFQGLALLSEKDTPDEIIGNIHHVPAFSDAETKHINAGNTLVTVIPHSDKAGRLLMVRATGPASSSRRLLIGEIRRDYLWDLARILPPSMEIFVFDENKNLLLSSFPEYFPRAEIERSIRKKFSSRQFTWAYNGNSFMASYWDAFVKPQFLINITVVSSQSNNTILRPLSDFKRIFLAIVTVTFLMVALLSIIHIRKNLTPLELLKRATRMIAAKDFTARTEIRSGDEFEDLGKSFNEMTESIEHFFRIMNNIHGIGLALTAEKDNTQLMELIVQGAKNILNADGGLLYTIAGTELTLSVMHFDSLNYVPSHTSNISVPLYSENGSPNTGFVAVYSVLNGLIINLPDIYEAEGFDFSGNLDFDRETGYRSRSFLSIPMKNHEDEIIGVLQLINASDRRSGDIVPFSEDDRRMAEALASQAAVALTKNRLVEDFKNLFDSMTDLIARAIDAKSEYTGGHCRRVPELTIMLAEAVNRVKDGAFRDVTFSGRELYELKVAALLHDCGKVTTPIHIVDKATKLETIFDRIHMVDARFEIVKRDLEIGSLRRKLAGSENGSDHIGSGPDDELREQIRSINEEREFLKTCNMGREFMSGDSIERVRAIARKYKWLDLNNEENAILSEEEVYNLTISSGTLTLEERNIINHHVIVTKKMLESLNYPKSLRNVTKIAEAHHERMDGKGYPMGIKGDQIPVQSRILAIADIFEALTAKDRPYKKRKTLMESLRILAFMAKEGHIDRDLFHIFIQEKIYQNYAYDHLLPDQVDEVDLRELQKHAEAEVKA